MEKIAYKTNNTGQVTDLRFVPDNYVATAGETIVQGDRLPDINTLHIEPYKSKQGPIAQSALAALNATDKIAVRCFKAGVPFTSDWQAYVVALRAIVANPVGVVILPSAPTNPDGSTKYPAGS